LSVDNIHTELAASPFGTGAGSHTQHKSVSCTDTIFPLVGSQLVVPHRPSDHPYNLTPLSRFGSPYLLWSEEENRACQFPFGKLGTYAFISGVNGQGLVSSVAIAEEEIEALAKTLDQRGC
jgi:hypothetical protein